MDDEKKQGYTIVFEKDNELLQQKLASVQRPSPLPVVYPLDEPLLSRMLAPVVVTATIRNDDPFNTPVENKHQGTVCKDYVCMNNIRGRMAIVRADFYF